MRSTFPPALAWVIVAHGLLRVAGGTSGTLIGLYLAGLSNHGVSIRVGLVGVLGAVGFSAELLAALPMGLASDATQPRRLMTAGALIGAVAAALFPLAGSVPVFFLSRTLEGIGAAAVVPALLAYIADATDASSTLRVRAMSYFELTLLAGLALGGVIAAQLFRLLQARAFLIVAVAYVACAVLLAINVSPTVARRLTNPIRDLRDVIALPSVRHLAPVWLCVNAVVGLWLGPTLIFLLTQHATSSQYLAGIYAAEPARVGWLLLSYAAVFGVGVFLWSFILPRMRVTRAMNIAVSAILPVCGTLFLLNHSAHQSVAARWWLGAVTAGLILIESGFTPAALAWLAQAVPIQSGRGAAMGIYSVLLSLGAIAGSLSAALLGERYSVDGLLFGTAVIAILALLFLNRVPGGTVHIAERGA